MTQDSVVVVGAGHAAGAFSAELRRLGHTGAITLIGEEPVAPYQRPPLSKGVLKGEMDQQDLWLRPLQFYEAEAITLQLESRVDRLDLAAQAVILADGRSVGFDRLVLATGSRARRLPAPGSALDRVVSLRTLADAALLEQALKPGRRIIVVGGGYVGLEVAAVARALGSEVVVVERETRCLARVACGPLSDFYQARHRDEGVEILTEVEVEAIEPDDNGGAGAVRLSDGRTLRCDLVLVGVGGAPADEVARAAGLACENGIVVDGRCRTSAPSVHAIGDVANRPLPLYDNARMRLESVPSALEMAKQAAADIMDAPPPVPETPWFWSDQYDVKLQIAGVPIGADRTIIRGDPSTGAFSVFHMAKARVVAVEAVNNPTDFMAGRQLIQRRASLPDALIVNSTTSARDLVQAAVSA